MSGVAIQPVDIPDSELEYLQGMLTPNQRLFCEEILADPSFNAFNAAKKAGYKAPTSAAGKLLANENVLKVIGAKIHKRVKKTEVTAQRVLEELACIAFLDPGEMYDEDGNLKHIRDMPERVRRAIASMEVDRRNRRGRGEDGEEDDIEETNKRIRMNDKMKALEMLAKHVGLLADTGININTGPQISLAEVLQGLYSRQKKPCVIEDRIAQEEREAAEKAKASASAAETIDAEILEVKNGQPSTNGKH